MQSTSVGYSTFNHLLFDMVSLSNTFQSGQPIKDEARRLKFKICVGTVIDLDDTSLPLGFLPIEVPRLTLQCGDDGYVRGNDPENRCTIRGGGKRISNSTTWNTSPQQAYKASKSGILGGGSVAQIYVYGESAYEITLRGLTFDNSLTREEMELYNDYVDRFGDTNDRGTGSDDGVDREPEEIEQQYDASVPNSDSSSSVNNDWGGANQLNANRDTLRRLQGEKDLAAAAAAMAAGPPWGKIGSGDVKPAHRFASVAVLGKGYGDDAGPRLITIEDCRFEYHRGYAILVSPGIQQPDLPVAPEFDFPQSPPSSTTAGDNGGSAGDTGVEDIMSSVNLQSSGQIYNGNNNTNNIKEEDDNNQNRRHHKQRRKLNLLDNGGKFIPQDGRVSYYDHAARNDYLDGRRVKIINSEFVNNMISGENVAGLVTSAYSLTLTDCFFQKNSAKAMIFVYNNEALVDNTIFAENTVEVSTVIMASPKGSKPLMTASASSASNSNGDGGVADVEEPTHIVERSCFVGSHVGMSNVLVTDVKNTGFGQRANHARGTEFSWVSKCEGGAAEESGNNCLETGNCDGTCIQFTSEKCQADRSNSPDYEKLLNAGRRSASYLGWWWISSLGTAVLVGWLLA